METEGRGTRDKPVIVDSPSTALYVDELNHVHDLDGNCIKNRYAVRCDPPLPLPPHGDYRDAIKTITGMARKIVELERSARAAQERASSYKEELIALHGAHKVVRIWQERPGEISWECRCGMWMKHQQLPIGGDLWVTCPDAGPIARRLA